jgi:propionyl-CoA carboxylase beta chain
MAKAEERETTHESTEAKLEWLEQLREEALHAGSEKSVERQRSEGKLLARERAERLCDPGSFVELDRYVRHREPNFGMLERRPYGDAVVTGYGTIFGRKVFVFSQDFTVFGGSLSEVFAEKICKVMDLAAKMGCPIIGINDSGGARIQEGVVSLAGYAEIFWRNVQCSGVIPQISLVMGPTAGGAVYSPAMTDFIFMVEGSSYMFITGPDVVKTVTGEEVTFEELGGATTHATRSGVAHFVAPDEQTCLDDARYLLSFLPQNNLDPPQFAEPSDPRDRESPDLDALVPDNPNKPYDMKQVIARSVDDGDFLEVHERFAENIVCGFARLGGHPVGLIGQPTARPCRRARHRLVDQGRALRPHLRRVQHPARHVRRRAGVPSRDCAGVGRHHPPRRQAPLRVRGSDRTEARRDHAQGLRRRVRRHELEAHPRRLQFRLAHRRGRGHGA